MAELTTADFFKSAPGQVLLTWESAQYDALVQDAFGYAALQVGCPQIDTLKFNRIAAQWITDPSPAALEGIALREGTSRVAANPEWLPFAAESLDLVTLPHTLDFSPRPHQALREAARVLHPEGRLVLSAFNPLSFWWLRQKVGVALGASPYLPSRTLPIALYRIKDWLELLGFEVEQGRFGIYSPWCRSITSFRKCDWVNKAGDRWAPHCANLIIVSAVKRLPGVKPLGKSPLLKAAEFIKPHGSGAAVPVPRAGGAQRS